jgi:Uma2 family endonuclease
MRAATSPMTADDLLRLGSDHQRHELVRGALTTMTPAGSEHGVIAARLARLVDGFAAEHDLGIVFGAETGFHIASDPDTVRAPDLAFVAKARVPASGIPKGFWPGAPDLAVEVVSPSDTYAEVQEKVRDWLGAGARLVWVLDPRSRTVAVHSVTGAATILTDLETLDGGDLLPGWSCRVETLFP